jgi:hypothetical protein
MSGLLEQLVTELLGPPTRVLNKDWPEFIWGAGNDDNSSILYGGLHWNVALQDRYSDLRKIYGNARGGFLFGGCLRLSMLAGPTEYGMYQIDGLQAQAAVREASLLDPEICFFMESANVWFYGIKNDDLFVFDTATDELDRLGSVEKEMERLFRRWVGASY